MRNPSWEWLLLLGPLSMEIMAFALKNSGFSDQLSRKPDMAPKFLLIRPILRRSANDDYILY